MWIVADVTFDTDAEAREAERLVREDKLAGVSVDIGNVTSELEIIDVDDDGFPVDWLETVTEGEILGATQVAMPAFADARLEATDDGIVAFLAPEGITTSDRRVISPGALTWRENAPLMFNDSSDGHEGAVHVGNLTNFHRVGQVALVASADPQLSGLMKPMVSDGKIVGHGAGWGTCHVGMANACITPPSSSYKHVPDGVNIYRHPRGDIHAPITLSLEDAAKWYETHCELVGKAGVGEDSHGIWVAGDTTLEDGEVFLSGDWRPDDSQLELISFLLVDKPGYPVARVANDTQTALVAAGIVTETQEPTIDERLARLESVLFSPTPSEELVEAFAVSADELEEAFN